MSRPLTHQRLRLVSVLLLLALVASLLPQVSPVPLAEPTAVAAGPGVPNTPAARTAAPKKPDLSKMGLGFVPNRGQADPAVRYEARGMGGSLFFTESGVTLTLPSDQPDKQQDLAKERQNGKERFSPESRANQKHKPSPPTVVRVQFEGANAPPTLEPTDKLAGVVNYFIGKNPSKWQKNLPNYGGLVYKALYPGIDLLYEGTAGRLKGTYLVAPGVDTSVLRWRYEGAAGVEVDSKTGDLVVSLPSNGKAPTSLREKAPVSWQEVDGKRVPVETRYEVAADGSIGFSLGSYDRSLPLTIDPTLEYSTYLGGSTGDSGYRIAVDTSGNAYITGYTYSTDFPTKNAFQGTSAGGSYDAFVTKLTSSGALAYSTYLGGGGDDYGHGIAVDTSGNAYVTGTTYFTDFPTKNAFQSSHGGYWDAFVTKLGPGDPGTITQPPYEPVPTADDRRFVGAVSPRHQASDQTVEIPVDRYFLGPVYPSSIDTPLPGDFPTSLSVNVVATSASGGAAEVYLNGTKLALQRHLAEW